MKLKQWMEEERWTVKRMAKELGCNASTLSSVRTGQHIPGSWFAIAIVRFTGEKVSLADLGIEEK